MSRPVLLDLFCGAGGAAQGYHDAGFEVVGIDLYPQPRYPFEFRQDDALNWIARMGMPRLALEFDAIHASPPCQHYSTATKRNGTTGNHPDLIGAVRGLLDSTGLPYVIENVVGAPLIEPELICGTALDLTHNGYRLKRHRLIEANWTLHTLPCACGQSSLPVLDVSGGGDCAKPRTDGAGGRPRKGSADEVRAIMGMPWATKAECNEAIPPAFAELIGVQLLSVL